MSALQPVRLYEVGNYSINAKGRNHETESKSEEQNHGLKDAYAKAGMRRSVHAVMLVNNHKHPHILLLQVKQGTYKLPGADLLPGEVEEVGMSRILNDLFAGPKEEGDESESTDSWPIVDTLAEWWRPYFDNKLYPYVPVHCTKPKEEAKVMLIQLPEKRSFFVPDNFKLVAVPLFLLYESKDYAKMIGALPQLLSRFSFNYASDDQFCCFWLDVK
eukprot:m.128755 g.128755  ORF g.128755 m.128755 type:complete len:216 (-) comp17444_c0_seq2:250-897(-)